MPTAAKSRQSCPTLCDPRHGKPTRLPRPWDSPGKNTGVGCHFLVQCMKVKSESEVAQSCLTLSDHIDSAFQALSSMGFSRQEYWSGSPLPSLYLRMIIIQIITEMNISEVSLSLTLGIAQGLPR